MRTGNLVACDDVLSCDVMSRDVVSGFLPCYVMWMRCNATRCDVMCDVVGCDVMSCVM